MESAVTLHPQQSAVQCPRFNKVRPSSRHARVFARAPCEAPWLLALRPGFGEARTLTLRRELQQELHMTRCSHVLIITIHVNGFACSNDSTSGTI
eukprot:gene9476-biopygen8589